MADTKRLPPAYKTPGISFSKLNVDLEPDTEENEKLEKFKNFIHNNFGHRPLEPGEASPPNALDGQPRIQFKVVPELSHGKACYALYVPLDFDENRLDKIGFGSKFNLRKKNYEIKYVQHWKIPVPYMAKLFPDWRIDEFKQASDPKTFSADRDAYQKDIKNFEIRLQRNMQQHDPLLKSARIIYRSNRKPGQGNPASSQPEGDFLAMNLPPYYDLSQFLTPELTQRATVTNVQKVIYIPKTFAQMVVDQKSDPGHGRRR